MERERAECRCKRCVRGRASRNPPVRVLHSGQAAGGWARLSGAWSAGGARVDAPYVEAEDEGDQEEQDERDQVALVSAHDVPHLDVGGLLTEGYWVCGAGMGVRRRRRWNEVWLRAGARSWGQSGYVR